MDNSVDFSPLSLESLQPLISTKWLGRPAFLFKQLKSTNSHALGLAEKGTPHGTVVVADCQTAGKGRLGREWHSPANMNIYFSVVLTQPPAFSFFSWIPLATGIAIAETIEEIANLNVSLKWPNDLLLDTKKLGGILCESTTKGPNGRAIIVGIGININCREIHFPQELKAIATSLAVQAGQTFDRHALLGTVFSKLESYYERIWDSDLSTLHSSYISRCSTLGRHVQVRLAGNTHLEGVASNIGHEGELLVIPSNSSVASMSHKPSTISIRAGDVIHLR
ncbi:MAG: biotin--[acetyl-CoA-carboxylase] ligase [Nitrospirota bacterium]|nr:MAG: biotin--[acetyl-CoA-carboxylase] ligase [Nitrospirota bacterium]